MDERLDKDEFFEEEEGPLGIAIVGMSLRLPGASDLETYWSNLRNGVESIRFFHDEELLAAGVDPDTVRNPNYVKARGALEDIELFDAAFFGLTSREAETMDPQHRLFLEESWRAVEHAGYEASTYDGAIGVFAGANLTGYLLHNLAPNDELVERVGPLQIRIRNDKDFLATLVAYKLDLGGPAVNVQTACSSSLVGVSLACQSLLSYQCDMVLAGGVSVTVPNPSGYLYQEGIYAPDGHCRAFDVGARGTVLGDGVAVVVLKRLEDALEEGDTIHAVIRGFAINNDGSLKLDYAAPSVDGQSEVIRMAHALGEIAPESISYIEAHGTGTPLGDPIEVAALTQAFRAGTDARGFCGLGSVKSNIGHLDAAAGVASLIKTVLALDHRQLPPTLHYEAPNPQLQLETSPFYVVDRLMPWNPPEGTPRRAGISSFGVGGTNAHVVVEEAPELEVEISPSRPWQLLTLSARTEDSLVDATDQLGLALAALPGEGLADAAWTLSVGRRHFPERRFVVCENPQDASAVLRGKHPARLLGGQAPDGDHRAIAFMFSGIGDHYPGMGQDLYRHEATFRTAMDRCAELLEPHLGLDVRDVLFPAAADGGDVAPQDDVDLRRMLRRGPELQDPHAERLNRTGILHPALFTLEYALAELIMSWGVAPEALIGYSIGEYVAALLSGVFSLEDALRVVAQRARTIEEQPEGTMLAVTLTEGELSALLNESRFADLSLAAVNGPAFCVAAGPVEAVAALEDELRGRNIVAHRLQARHAFHSRMLEPAMDRFRDLLRGVTLNPPQIPFLSNVTGTWISPEEATDPEYWAAHMCRTVRFGDGVRELLTSRPRGLGRVLLEIGPGQGLSSVVLQEATVDDEVIAFGSLPHAFDPQPAQAFLLATLGRLWASGAEVDWAAFWEGQERRRLPLPTYAFDRQRYWVEPVERRPPEPELSLQKRSNPHDWFYVPTWRQKAPLGPPPAAPDERWLVVAASAEPGGLVHLLAERLRAAGGSVMIATEGTSFSSAENRYYLDGSRREDYEALFQALAATGHPPRRLVYLRSVPAMAQEDVCFFDLLLLVQAWENTMGAEEFELALVVVSSGAFDVTGIEDPAPEKALLAGPCRVIPQEYPRISCRQIDLPDLPGSTDLDRLTHHLAAELLAAKGPLVALRGRRRWVRNTEPMDLPSANDSTTGLRPQGTYLITGGLGGIGLTLAQHLAERWQARLVLVGRSPFPDRDRWPEVLSTRPSGERIHRTVRRLEAFEAAGAEVLVLRGDVTDLGQMEAVRDAATERFGTLHGVIHAAGQAPGGLIQLKDRETAAAVLAPKVEGTRIVDRVFGGPNLDFLVLCSSLTAFTGALGLVDHTAANAFQNAFAQRNARHGGTRTLAVAWDSWLEVGQAAEAGVAARIEAVLAPASTSPDIPPFPSWDHRQENDEHTFACRLTGDHWILREHRFQGESLLPGTAYLELARRAAAARFGDQAMRIEKVVFSQPCRLAPGSDRILRLRLTSAKDTATFTIESAVDVQGPWLEHATGQITPGIAEEDIPTHDFAALAARCPAQEITMETLPLVDFGPRWTSLLRELRHGEREGWARLELPAEFQADLETLPLHPALADVATGISRVLGQGIYLPMSYDEVRVLGPLPAAIQCSFRIAEDSARTTLVSDIQVADLEGRVVLDVRGYALRYLDSAPEPAETPRAPAATAVSSGMESPEHGFGLLPPEGAEAFARLMVKGLDEPEILVSVRDFSAAQKEMERLTGDRAADHLALLGAGTATPTQGFRAPFEAPRSDLERTLVGLFEDMLGETHVGIHDNFFDLGGNSLVATQLITRLRRTFDVEITLRTLFEAPTADELSRRVVEEQAAHVEEEDLTAALAELSELSPEELMKELEQAKA